jgi:DNA primase
LKHSKLLKESLGRAVNHYAQNIGMAEEYLLGRGIDLAVARTVHLGLVVEPLTGHEQFAGRLSIPYLTPTGVVDIRFRSIDGSEPKYMGMPGTETRLYNVRALHEAQKYIAVCEGEIDAITLHYQCGIPSIGVPGANSWKRHYTRLLQDFEQVFVFADGDQPGSDFGKKVAREVQGSVIVNMPDGHDVNSIYCTYGKNYFISKIG